MIGKIKSQQTFYSEIRIYLSNALKLNPFRSNSSHERRQLSDVLYREIIKTAELLLRWRWWLIMMMGLSFLIVEIDEHLYRDNQGRFSLYHVDFDFWRETLIYGLIIPLVLGVVLSVLGRTKSRRDLVVHHLDRQQELNQQLINILEWDELANLLVRFPHTIAPFTNVFLLVYNQDHTKLELVAEWQDATGQAPPPVPLQLTDFHHACMFVPPFSLNTLVSCRCPSSVATSAEDNYYCLPLVHGNLPIALLHLYVPPGTLLNAEQIDILNGIAPSMALAIEGVRPQPSVTQAAATEAERRRIVRHLHDSLGQHLGYLRLKLDQLTGDDILWEIVAVKQELGHMRDIANEAYEQVRETLAALHPSNSVDLTTALLAQAKLASDQVNFKVELTSTGQARPLSPLIQHQVIYLFQEALTNIAKHAQAQHVRLDLTWAADALIIKLSDDGQGFELDAIQSDRHFGLAIMRDRAEEISGRLTLTSHLNVGTELTLQLPLDLVA